MELTKQQIEDLRKEYAINYGSKEFETGLELIKKMILYDKYPVEDPTMTLLGGQQGSGKTQLLLMWQVDNIVRLSLDECTRFHPKLEDMLEYPDLFAYLTYETGLMWRNEIYNQLVKEKYNVITEGTLKDEQGTVRLINELRENGYNVNAHIMATGIVESGLSVFERYEEEILSGVKFPRLTECVSSYSDIPKTVKRLEDEDLCDIIKVFRRGKKYEASLIYSSDEENSRYKTAYECLLETRRIDNLRAIPSLDERIRIIKELMIDRNATGRELMQLENFRTTLEKDFIKLDRGGENDGRAC